MLPKTVLIFCALTILALACKALNSTSFAETEADTEISPQKDSSWIESRLVQVLIAILIGAGGFGYLLCQPKKKRFKGDAVFLVGPCDAGKTSLFYRIRDGIYNVNLRTTHTSLITNEDSFVVHESSNDGDKKPVRFIDFPGHRRLRPLLFSNLEDCRGLILVVDSCTFTSHLREIAELMLDLLTSTSLMKNGRKLLVLCNKVDALPDDFAGIDPKNMVRKKLETEVDALRVSRASGLGETDASVVRVELEIAGTAFRWTDSPLDVEFVNFSAKTAEGMEALLAWLSSLNE